MRSPFSPRNKPIRLAARRRIWPRAWPLGLYRVAGASLAPAFQPGDMLLGWRWARPRVGKVVVAEGPGGRLLIKRVRQIDAAGLWLEGDNAAASTDSRQFGALPPAAFEAVIICRLARSE